jgi:plasmid maintenance system antidote protein VapI
MKHEPHPNPVEYDPNLLLDGLLQKLGLKNDAALAGFLSVNRAVISRLRRRRAQVTSGVFIRMHDVTGLSIRELRSMMGDNRRYCLVTQMEPRH